MSGLQKRRLQVHTFILFRLKKNVCSFESVQEKKKKSPFLQKFLQQFESYTPHKQGNVSTVIDCAVFFLMSLIG